MRNPLDGPAAGEGVRHQPRVWLNGQLALDLYRAINDEKEISEVE